MKSLLSMLITIMIILTVIPGNTMASAGEVSPRGETYSGQCGDNMTWALNTSTGILKISGNGAIKDYYYDDDAPWYSYADDIKTVIIGDAVTGIGDYAFSYCKSLTSVTIPNSVTRIGEGVFSGCTGLTEITIPNSVTSISDYAFYGCTGITSIMIPNSVTSIGDWVFSWCSGLTSITTTDGNNSYCSQDGVLFNKDKTKLICCPEGKTGTFTIPESITRIDNMMFYNCTGLTGITIPNSITIIGNWSFSGCTGLTEITIPNSVTSIGKEAFSHCRGLTRIAIPNSVISIGDRAFSDCINLTDITAVYSNNKYSSLDGVLFNKDKTELICCPQGKSGIYAVPNGVTGICEDAFWTCDKLKGVIVSDGVTSIGDDAFKGCDNITVFGFTGSYIQQYAKEKKIWV